MTTPIQETDQEMIRHYKLLAENMVDCIWLLDFNTGRFKYISPAVYTLRGLTQEEAMAESLQDSLTPESYEKMRAIAAEALPAYLAGALFPETTETLCFINEFQQFHKNGHIVDVEISTHILRNSDPNVIEVVGVTRDISVRKALERELLREVAEKTDLIERLKASEAKLTQLAEELKLKNAALEKATITDRLTGAYNRFYFEKRAAVEIDRSRRYGTPLSLMIFDLDFFKKINDQWGHGFGDAVLKRMAAEVLASIRSVDLFARWGGEEFVVLMPGTDQRHAVQAAEKLRRALGQILHPSIGRVTASFGVAEHRYGEQLENWFTRVDRAMYRSKSLGRNMVSEWSDHAYLTETSELQWSEDWASGHHEIDVQHMALLDGANTIIALMQQDASLERVLKVFDEILAHVEDHFRFEEALLKQTDYPEVAFHERFHQHLVFKGHQMRGKLQEGGLVKSDMIMYLMDEIIVGHLLTEDLKFFPWMGRQTKS